jgi:hypothetical protein
LSGLLGRGRLVALPDACHAGHVAEERWHEEIGLRSRLPQSSGDAEAVRFLLSRFPSQRTPSIRRETALMAHALVDAQWPSVRRLVRVLCARRLPVRLPRPVVTRLIESTPEDKTRA